MRAKRQKDHKAITSFQQGRQEGPGSPAPQEEQPEKEAEEMEESVEVQAPVQGPWSLGLGLGFRKEGSSPSSL